MWELWYYCPRRGKWLHVDGPDYDSFDAALRTAHALVLNSGRQLQVRDLYTNEVLASLSPTAAPVY
jgi:hypothetical protein